MGNCTSKSTSSDATQRAAADSVEARKQQFLQAPSEVSTPMKDASTLTFLMPHHCAPYQNRATTTALSSLSTSAPGAANKDSVVAPPSCMNQAGVNPLRPPSRFPEALRREASNGDDTLTSFPSMSWDEHFAARNNGAVTPMGSQTPSIHRVNFSPRVVILDDSSTSDDDDECANKSQISTASDMSRQREDFDAVLHNSDGSEVSQNSHGSAKFRPLFAAGPMNSTSSKDSLLCETLRVQKYREQLAKPRSRKAAVL